MAIKAGDLAKIKYPNSKYPQEMFVFLVEEIDKNSNITTEAVARVWIEKRGLPGSELKKISASLNKFRIGYLFLNEVSSKSRVSELIKQRPVGRSMLGYK